MEEFRSGGSFLIRKSVYERYVSNGKPLGRPDGLFITTRVAMDKMLAKANGDLLAVKKSLGIPADQWNEPLVRVDVFNPLQHNARFPSGFEEGANPLFKWGGYTKGEMPEIAVDPIHVKDFVGMELPLKDFP